MQNFKRIKKWIPLWAGLLLFGCATTRDVQILDQEAYRLHSELNTLQKEIEGLKKDLSTFQNNVQSDTATLQNETKRLQSDLLLRVENLQSEIRTLSTGVDEYKEFLKKPSMEIERVREDVFFRTKVLEDKGKSTEERSKAQEGRIRILEDRTAGIEDRFKKIEGKIDSVISKQPESEKSVSSKEISSELRGVSTGVGDFYRDAYETFQKGDLEEARRRFEAFLKQYPNTELSDNAQFWIGETYYLKKDFEKSILEYEKVIVKYPEGDKVPAALLKQALAFLELGDKANARNLLKRTIERYPHSDQAEIAKKRLEEIK